MTIIPKSHPRLNSLLIREKLVKGFDNNLVAKRLKLEVLKLFLHLRLIRFYIFKNN